MGGLLDADEALGDGLPHAAEQFIFEFRDPFLGTQDFGFEFFQFAGDVPLGIREGLLADPFLRYVALERTGHFEVVAEDLVVADLQFRDAGAFPLLGFDGGEVPLTVRDDVAEFIEFGTVALFDHAAFPDREGRVFGDGLLDEGHDVFQGVDVRLDALHEAGLCALQKQFDGQQALYGLIEAAQLSRVRRAVGDAGDEPFHIVDGSHVLGDLIAQGEVVHEVLHRVLAFRDAAGRQQGLFDPGPEQTLAHRRPGLVEDPEEGAALLPVAERFSELKVPPGGEVELHIFVVGVELDLPDVLEVCLLDFEQVLEGHAEGTGAVLGGQFQFLEALVEVVGDDPLHVLEPRLPFFQGLDAGALLFLDEGLEALQFGTLRVD